MSRRANQSSGEQTMEEETEQLQKLTLANTKKEMLAAYRELLKKLQEKNEKTLDAEKEIEQKVKRQALQAADSLSTEGVVRGIGALKAEMGTLLGQLSDRLEAEVTAYNAIKRAIEAKEEELKEIYEIERAAGTLAALIEAQRQKRESFEAEMAARKEELQQETQDKRFEWEEEKARHMAEVKERDAAEQKKRQREKEEYEYTFEREQKLARDQFEDEKKKLQAELEAQKNRLETELGQREAAVVGREKELAELRQKVEAFPKQLEAAVQRTAKEATERAQQEARTREELLVKEFNGEKNVLTARVESLEKTIAEQNQQIARLSQAMERAYQQVQDIAVKAVEGSSNAKALTGLQQFLSEQKKASRDQ